MIQSLLKSDFLQKELPAFQRKNHVILRGSYSTNQKTMQAFYQDRIRSNQYKEIYDALIIFFSQGTANTDKTSILFDLGICIKNEHKMYLLEEAIDFLLMNKTFRDFHFLFIYIYKLPRVIITDWCHLYSKEIKQINHMDLYNKLIADFDEDINFDISQIPEYLNVIFPEQADSPLFYFYKRIMNLYKCIASVEVPVEKELPYQVIRLLKKGLIFLKEEKPQFGNPQVPYRIIFSKEFLARTQPGTQHLNN